jgi:5-methylcytosine-specific restriction endonuclease McrA
VRKPVVALGNNELRRIVWSRDKRRCVRCQSPVDLNTFICDQVDRRKHRKVKNLRTLCSDCARALRGGSGE